MFNQYDICADLLIHYHWGNCHFQLTSGSTACSNSMEIEKFLLLSCGHVWWMKSVCMCASVGWGVHCKCFLAYPVWLLNCLNQSCRWSDLSLARLWCETISPGPWGPPTVKPTALPNQCGCSKDPCSAHRSLPCCHGKAEVFLLGIAGCQLISMLNYFKSPLARNGIAAGAVYWQHGTP